MDAPGDVKSLENVLLIHAPPTKRQRMLLDDVATLLADALEHMEGVEQVILSGSFSRDVWNARNGCSDLDFIVVLDKELHGRVHDTPGAWLGNFRKELNLVFTGKIRMQRSSLGLVLNIPTEDQKNQVEFVVDIVPVTKSQGNCFRLPQLGIGKYGVFKIDRRWQHWKTRLDDLAKKEPLVHNLVRVFRYIAWLVNVLEQGPLFVAFVAFELELCICDLIQDTENWMQKPSITKMHLCAQILRLTAVCAPTASLPALIESLCSWETAEDFCAGLNQILECCALTPDFEALLSVVKKVVGVSVDEPKGDPEKKRRLKKRHKPSARPEISDEELIHRMERKLVKDEQN